MEELLTQVSVAVELLSFSYVAGSLALFTHQRFTHKKIAIRGKLNLFRVERKANERF